MAFTAFIISSCIQEHPAEELKIKENGMALSSDNMIKSWLGNIFHFTCVDSPREGRVLWSIDIFFMMAGLTVVWAGTLFEVILMSVPNVEHQMRIPN